MSTHALDHVDADAALMEDAPAMLDLIWAMLTDTFDCPDLDLNKVSEPGMTLNERNALTLLRKHGRI